jgi:2'-5' RNA ligase
MSLQNHNTNVEKRFDNLLILLANLPLQLLVMTAYKDYLITLNPSYKVKDNVKLYKRGASEFIGNYPGLNSTAHISLWNKQKIKPEVINALITILQRKINNIPSTKINIDGFKYFVHGNDLMTIYASVQMNIITDSWFKLVRKQLNLKGDFVPHITVTKTIHIDAFFKLWPIFNQLPFQMSFVPESISVLERHSGLPGATWQLRKEIYFDKARQV